MAKESILQDSDVRWNRREGRPRKIRGEFALPSADTTEEAILTFLRQNADELHLWISDEDLQVIQDVSTPLRRILRYRQLHDGIPIFRSLVMVQIDTDDRVRQIDLGHEPQVRVVPPAEEKRITPRTALKAASSSLGDFKLRQETPEPELVYYPTPKGLRLAYLVLIPTREPLHDWRMLVDAYSEEILDKEDLIVCSADNEEVGEGLVFDPNPVVTAADATLRDPTATPGSCGFTGSLSQTIDAERVVQSLKGIEKSGDKYQLEGPYVKLVNFGPPDIDPPEETNKDEFNYDSGDDRFAAVMVYHHVDTIQRYIQDTLKISYAHNKQIEADAHHNDPDRHNGAFFSTIDKGLHFGDSENCSPDRAQDADCILHEYGHAIQEDQVPGWGQRNTETDRYETDAMGEGFGDILACIYFAPDHHGFQREVFEDWIFANDGGLRRVDGTKVYDSDWLDYYTDANGHLQREEHANGQIWSAALWNIYRAIGGDSLDIDERRAARDILLGMVIRSHSLLTPDATMPEGAEAVMEVDDWHYGRHLMEMLDSFHDRGLVACSPNADLHIRTAIDDDGTTPYTGEQHWNSPDVWVRRNCDNGWSHQEPLYGQDNWLYARVRNRGTELARAFVVTFNVIPAPYLGEFVYPENFAPLGPNGHTYLCARVGFNLEPGHSRTVRAKWPAALVPSSLDGQPCVLASVYAPTDVPPSGSRVWEHNNLAEKRVTVIHAVPNELEIAKLDIQHFYPETALLRIELMRPRDWWDLPVYIIDPLSRSPSEASPGSDGGIMRKLFYSVEEFDTADTAPVEQPIPVLHFLEPTRVEIAHRGLRTEPVRLQLGHDSILDIGSRTRGLRPAHPSFGVAGRQASLVTDKMGVPAIKFHPGRLTGFPVVLKPRSRVRAALRIEIPAHAQPGDVIELDLILRNRQGQAVGGRTVLVNVV